MLDRKTQILIICSLLFMGALVVADVTSSKMLGIGLPSSGFSILFPAGTIAFAFTFLATDVIGELFSKRHSLLIVWGAVIIRALVMLYFIIAIGDANGDVWIFSSPEYWTGENQASYAFVLGGSIGIYIAGFVAIVVSSLLDVTIFHNLKRKHGKKLFWFRNNVSTILGQVINSTIFITIAFISVLNIPQIISAIAGQVIAKVLVAIIDTPIAYAMRNYALNRSGWYNMFSSQFWSESE